MGQLIILGTLFGLIILIFGLVIYFDPEARGDAGSEPEAEAASDRANR
ncbi:hypothetical protein [Mycolicibacterium moriokaense]|uniref:Uncharacterized protein n=1 Tax=Mycolicibacterium moriokaense TaxID=39691 RepID=A0AAD1HEV9_9MYCO|nr:hypothetical protein [Mycolicibacterium moriokaense]MCV7040393.1 hypothetical protein [Mycolicibacterium moriokaense]BBX03339.1 hypothetical protein MMOR_42750 [Mycolicibacterium moriokaense]